MHVLLTGSSGFVGGEVLKELQKRNDIKIQPVFRIEPSQAVMKEMGHCIRPVIIPSITDNTNWSAHLNSVDVVVHAAARVHFMQENAPNVLDQYRAVNVKGTMNLARQAAESGVRRFIFISTVKVGGEETSNNNSFLPIQTLAPLEPYALSKWEAEQELIELSNKTAMEVVIIRPVLVYGPGVKANFLSMVKWVNSGVPLPLGAISNKRSLVSLGNLVDFIIICLHHPAAANEIFLVSDGEDLSTTELLKRVAKALGVPSRLLPVPAGLLKFVAYILGKKHIAQRLCGSLQVDISKNKELLGWQPPLSIDDALQQMAQYFK